VVALLAACGGGQSQQLSATKLGDVSYALPGEGAATSTSECGDGTPTAAGSRQLDRLPYLQRTSDTGTTVLFTTYEADAEPPVLELKSPEGELIEAVEAVRDPGASDGRQWYAMLSELEPSASYCYAIAGWTLPTELRTAPPPGSTAPVRFVVFGDSGSESDGQLAVRDQLARVPFDLMLHTGDIAYENGALEALEQSFFDVYGDYLRNVPVFPTSGNHDYRTAGADPFRRVFDLPENGGAAGQERWYSFDFGDVHFVALDTEWELAVQSEWLERDLSANQLPWTIVYLHRPPFSSGEHGSNPEVRNAFVPLFERHGVQLVFAGHDHDYERTLPINGVTYVVTGGGGRGARSVGSSSFTAFSDATLHFVAGSVDGSSLVLHAIDATGQTFDSLRLTL
jgi:3',5'-cyclic AMP phosphodiesterase CpdA